MGISSNHLFEDDSKPKIVMGYPSMDRYNPHTQQMYNPNQPLHAHVYSTKSPFHDPQNPYPQQQYDPYYDPHHYNTFQPEQEDKVSFGSLMLILLIVLVACMGLMSIVMWLLFGTSIPQFEVQTFKVSNFTVTDSKFTGSWMAEFMVENINGDLTVNFGHVRSAIFYEETMMGIYSVPPMGLDKRDAIKFGFNISAENMENPMKFGSSILPGLAHDLRKGSVIFSLRLAMMANFMSGETVYRKETLKVLCENLVVKFTEDGEGTYMRGLHDRCLIRLHGDSME